MPAVAGYYTAPNGQMLSLPFNSSTTIFYYNKDAFKAAGLDPDKPPATWPEVVLAAAKLKASGHKCPFTTGWQQLDPARELLGLAQRRVRDQEQRPRRLDARLKFNTPLHLRHIENLANMAKQGLFVYKGRDNKPDATFLSGECAMIDRLGRPLRQRRKNAKFAYGLAAAALLPGRAGRAAEHRDRRRQPVGDVGQEAGRHTRASPAFFNYLSSPEVQSASHKRTGYLPITTAAYKLTERVGFYKENPGTDVAVNQMIRKTTDKSRGIRLGNFLQIRTIVDEELEQVWAGKKSAKEALDAIVKRGNEQLERFQKANKS